MYYVGGLLKYKVEKAFINEKIADIYYKAHGRCNTDCEGVKRHVKVLYLLGYFSTYFTI